MFKLPVLAAAVGVVVVVCCSGRVVKRAAVGGIDICEVAALDVEDGTSYDVASPNYGYGRYRDNTNCALVLKSGDEPLLLTIKFEAGSIEFSSQCSYDSLCMHGVPFCGSWAAGQRFQFLLPEESSFTLRFTTDFSVTQNGFSLHIEARVTTSEDEAVFQPTSGFGSRSQSILYEQVFYNSASRDAYVDKCASNNTPVDSGNWYNNSPAWNATQNNHTSPAWNATQNNHTTPGWNATQNNRTTPAWNATQNNHTTPAWNATQNNRTTPAWNATQNNHTTPAWNATQNNHTTPAWNATQNNRTTPAWNATQNNHTTPAWNVTQNNHTTPAWTGSQTNRTTPAWTGSQTNRTIPAWTGSQTNRTTPAWISAGTNGTSSLPGSATPPSVSVSRS